MINALSEVVRSVAIIVILTSFLDMLLPNTNLQRFIKVVMGLFIMVTILNPIVSLLSQDMELNIWQLHLPPNEDVNTVLAQGREMSDLQQYQILEEYKIRVEQQIKAMVKLIPEIETVNCNITIEPTNELGGIAKITSATLWVTLISNDNQKESVKPVNPVRIYPNASAQISSPEIKDPIIKQKIIDIVENYFSLNKNAIEVFING